MYLINFFTYFTYHTPRSAPSCFTKQYKDMTQTVLSPLYSAHWAEALTGIRKLSIFPLFVPTLNPYN